MHNKNVKSEIDNLEFEINNQELDGKSAAGFKTAIRMTARGQCGGVWTISYECTSPNVRCA